jgi:hypothetical protein
MRSCVSFLFSTTLWPAWKLGSERGWVGERGPVSERGRARERETERGADREGAAWGWEGFRVQGLGLGEVPAFHFDGMTLGCVEAIRTLSGGHSGPQGPSAGRLLRASFSKVSALVHLPYKSHYVEYF